MCNTLCAGARTEQFAYVANVTASRWITSLYLPFFGLLDVV